MKNKALIKYPALLRQHKFYERKNGHNTQHPHIKRHTKKTDTALQPNKGDFYQNDSTQRDVRPEKTYSFFVVAYLLE